MMDYDKDGVLGKEDLRQTHDWVGRMTTDKELDEMLRDADGPINLVTLLGMFATRMAGGKLLSPCRTRRFRRECLICSHIRRATSAFVLSRTRERCFLESL